MQRGLPRMLLIALLDLQGNMHDLLALLSGQHVSTTQNTSVG